MQACTRAVICVVGLKQSFFFLDKIELRTKIIPWSLTVNTYASKVLVLLLIKKPPADIASTSLATSSLSAAPRQYHWSAKSPIEARIARTEYSSRTVLIRTRRRRNSTTTESLKDSFSQTKKSLQFAYKPVLFQSQQLHTNTALEVQQTQSLVTLLINQHPLQQRFFLKKKNPRETWKRCQLEE